MKRDVDRSYLAIVVLLMLVLPLASLLIETREPGLALVGKWWKLLGHRGYRSFSDNFFLPTSRP
jgi:hypothetical protein